MTSASSPLLEVKDLVMEFPIRGGILGRTLATVKAVSGVSFEILKGETLGLVGESGCGKSTLGRCLLRLYRPTRGKILYGGHDIRSVSSREFFPWRRKMQIVFQDPFASLNPRMTVEDILTEPLMIHKLHQGSVEQKKRVAELLDLCGLRRESMNRYPHEFSGGQRQRIAIARALAVEPEFIVCDEPVSALDVSIQAQIVNLLEDLQKTLGLTFLFIAHDLKVVRHISNRVAVMYLGRIVEWGEVEEIYSRPRHPYTRALLSAIPSIDFSTGRSSRKRIVLKGEVGSSVTPPPGCPFHPRCPKAQPICAKEMPEDRYVGSSRVACHFPEE